MKRGTWIGGKSWELGRDDENVNMGFWVGFGEEQMGELCVCVAGGCGGGRTRLCSYNRKEGGKSHKSPLFFQNLQNVPAQLSSSPARFERTSGLAH